MRGVENIFYCEYPYKKIINLESISVTDESIYSPKSFLLNPSNSFLWIPGKGFLAIDTILQKT